MRKSTLFISAALTTFMLAMMFGVASAYQKIVQTGISTGTSQQVQPANGLAATSAASTGMTLEEAATLASSVIGRTDLYAAENTQLDGVDVYLVTFSSGDLVYVSLDGKIVSISKIPVKYVLGQAASQGGGGGNTASDAPAASASTSGNTGGDEDHSNEDDPNNTADHANEDHPGENDD